METVNKAANSGYQAFDKIFCVTSQSLKISTKKGEQLNYIRDNLVTLSGIADDTQAFL